MNEAMKQALDQTKIDGEEQKRKARWSELVEGLKEEDVWQTFCSLLTSGQTDFAEPLLAYVKQSTEKSAQEKLDELICNCRTARVAFMDRFNETVQK